VPGNPPYPVMPPAVYQFNEPNVSATTFPVEFFENAVVYAYGTNGTDYDLSSTIAIVPSVMGVQSTTHSTYDLYSANQIAVDAAGIVLQDGVEAVDGESLVDTVRAKLRAAGVVTVKKATNSQVREYSYKTDLSTFVFDEISVTPLTIKA
jgi:hypothetical protein